MTLPANLTTIEVTGEFLDTEGNPLSGTLSFAPPSELVDINTAIMYSTPVTVTLDVTGKFTATLIATDNPTLVPAGWGYTVTENVRTQRTYVIYVPSTLGASVDLSTLVPMPTLTGTSSTSTVSAVAPGYAALAYNNTFTGTNTFDAEVTVPTPVNATDAVTKAYVDARVPMLDPSGDTSGTTDTTAIQNAIDALPAAGGIITLGAGTFWTKLLTIPSNVSIEGLGSGATVIQLAAGQNTDLIQTTSFSTLTGTDTSSTPHGFGLRGLTLDGNKTAQTSGANNCLSVYGYGYRIQDVVFRNATGWGFWSEWGSASPFLGPDGMEAFILDIKVHDCDGGTLNWIGPHDSQIVNAILIKNSGYTAGTAAFQVPTDGRANGSLFVGVHVYGAAYDYGVLAAAAGVMFADCQFEGAGIAQMKVNASQVIATDCRWFWGNTMANTSRGIVIGDSTHTNINGLRLTGKVENCSAAAIDLTYATGGSNRYDLLATYVSPFAVANPAVLGTPAASDYATILVTDNSGATTSSCLFQIPDGVSVESLSIGGVSIPAITDQDPLGYGWATTVTALSAANGGDSAFAADYAYFQQLVGYGMSTNTLRIYVTASSGNIDVGLYDNGGQTPASTRLPNALQASTGAIPCPAAGLASVTLTSTVTIGRSWYAAVSLDNTTAALLRAAPTGAITAGIAANQASAHPLPATASASSGSGTFFWIGTD